MVLAGIVTKKRMQFTSLQFMFWATFAVIPFTVVFLTDRGLSTTSIGLMLSINSLIGILSQPVWGMISDWLKSVKKVFIFCFGISSIFYVFLPFVHSTILIGILLSLNTFFKSSVVSLLDIWITSSIHDDDISYGSLRLWGSVGFAIMVLFYGQIVDITSISIIFPIYFVISIITIILCLNIKDAKAVMQNKFKKLKPGKLFKNYYFVTFIAFVLLLNIPNNPTSSFLPVLFKEVGGTTSQYGLMHSLKAFMEIPFFLFGKFFLDKLGTRKVLLIAALIYAIQQFMFASASSPIQVIIAQLLLGPAYSLLLLGTLYYVMELAPSGLRTTAQTFANALGTSLAAIIGNYGGGLFIDHFGLRTMFRTGTVLDIITISLFIVSLFAGRYFVKKQESNNDDTEEILQK